MSIPLVARMTFTYAGRRLRPGDIFNAATRSHAQILRGTKRAIDPPSRSDLRAEAPQPHMPPPAPPPPPMAEPPRESPIHEEPPTAEPDRERPPDPVTDEPPAVDQGDADEDDPTRRKRRRPRRRDGAEDAA